jgi:hypothetical protein
VKSNTLKTITLSIIIFLFFLSILELVFRTTHLFGARISWAQPDPLLGYKFTPGQTYWSLKENDHPITGKINSFSWRDEEWSIKKPENVYRIAVLGDSVVEAIEVELDHTFMAIAEKEFNQHSNNGMKIELMSFGRTSFTQTEELLVLKTMVEQFSPDMVMVFFLPLNDIQDVSLKTTTNHLRPFFHVSETGELQLDTSFTQTKEFKTKQFINWFKQHSALISLMTERYNMFQNQRMIRAKKQAKQKIHKGEAIAEDRPAMAASHKRQTSASLPKYLTLCTANPDSTYLDNYRLNKILIKAMADFCKAKNYRFMLVTVNNEAYVPEVENQFKSVDPTFNPNWFEDDMQQFASSIEVQYLGLQRVFQRAYIEKGVPLHWGHWNYEGHEVAAHVIVEKLKTIISQR